jgi:hypothetical protein
MRLPDESVITPPELGDALAVAAWLRVLATVQPGRRFDRETVGKGSPHGSLRSS